MYIRHLVFISAAVFTVSCVPRSPETTQNGNAPAAITASVPAETKEIKPIMAILTNPAKATEKAPENFKVKFTTTKGGFTLEVNRSWAPLGADRFYNLVKAGFFTDVAFFRVIEGFMVQFGIHGDPAVAAAWRGARIKDDPVVESNKMGYVSYAMAGPDTRTSQMFINFGDNARLDSSGFSPFGKITDGMAVVESIHSGYGEGAPSGMGPDQGRIQTHGNKYLRTDFPRMDYILSVAIE